MALEVDGLIEPDGMWRFDVELTASRPLTLDSLRMVGILQRGGAIEALIKTQDGTVHRVKTGNYLGQNNGKITLVAEDKVEMTEIVSDGAGGWLERQASVALSE